MRKYLEKHSPPFTQIYMSMPAKIVQVPFSLFCQMLQTSFIFFVRLLITLKMQLIFIWRSRNNWNLSASSSPERNKLFNRLVRKVDILNMEQKMTFDLNQGPLICALRGAHGVTCWNEAWKKHLCYGQHNNRLWYVLRYSVCLIPKTVCKCAHGPKKIGAPWHGE